MALSPQKFREIVFQLLYSHDFSEASPEDMEALLMRELAVTSKTMRAADELKGKIHAEQQEIDRLIATLSKGYDFDRIPRIERNILRLCIYELLHDKTLPPKVAIAEGIRLSKKFATPESAHFINAILDAVYKTHSESLIK